MSHGDRRRFGRLYERHYQALLAYAVRRTSQPADAADVVADTFLVAWRRIAAVPPEPETLPWLYGVARRTLLNHHRGEGRELRLRSRLTQLPGLTEARQHAEVREELASVVRALGRLDDMDQEVLRLAAWEGLAPRQIATVLACSDNAAALRLHRARRRLRDELAKEQDPNGHTSTQAIDDLREENRT